MKKNTLFHFLIPIYDWDIYVSWCSDDKTFYRYFDKELPGVDITRNGYIASVYGFESEKTSANFSILDIFQNYKMNNPVLYEVLAHEIFHIVYQMGELIGLSLSNDSHEAYAYLNGYIYGKIYEELSKKEKHDNKRTSKKKKRRS